MTETKIRSILTGLKSEIRREKDRERIVQLCLLGLYWSEELRTSHLVICQECGKKKPLSSFGFSRPKGYVIRRKRCNRCLDDAIRKKLITKVLKKKRESVLK